MNEKISQLQEAGFRISLDDFGSGYSSMNTLSRLKINELKLDRGFLLSAAGPEHEKSRLIMGQIIQLSHQLDISTVSEGVETAEDEEFIRSIGCDVGQGYFYHRPISAKEFHEIYMAEPGKRSMNVSAASANPNPTSQEGALMADKTYIAIDLKSFYASVECRERSLDPMETNLVVADPTRTSKTICLAVSPALKAYGIPGRPRLFEVEQKIREVNAKRRWDAPGNLLTGSSCLDSELKADPSLAVDFVTAPPRMARYMEISAQIYQIYLKYIAPEDMHVYSIDEVFIDATGYLKTYHLTARELARRIILDILDTTQITATAGIGTNLYLCKTAMDIEAKHIPADANGVRIAELTEESYRRSLWTHRPLTDFWRVGRGYARKLEKHGMFTMGDIARCSLGKPTDYYNEDLLYQLFGVNAELLIDHAWGWEPCTIAAIKAYKPAAAASAPVRFSPALTPSRKPAWRFRKWRIFWRLAWWTRDW